MSPCGQKIRLRCPQILPGSETTAYEEQGLANSPAPYATSSSIWLSSGRFRLSRDCLRSHVNLDLFRLRFLGLGDMQR